MTHDDRSAGRWIGQRRDNAYDWDTDNPVLRAYETGWETDTRRVKFGDGTTAWRDLPYAVGQPDDHRTLRYAEDVANAGYSLGVGVFTQLPLTFSIPPTDVDVTLSWGGSLTINTAGNGGITVAPADVTAGVAPTGFASVSGTRAGAFLTGAFSSGPTHAGEANIGPSDSWRVYRLYGFVGRDVGSLLAATYRASGNPPILKTWMKATVG
jgi:hypothetical protein